MELCRATSGDAVEIAKLRIDMLCEADRIPDGLLYKVMNNTATHMETGLADGSVVYWLAVEEAQIVGMGCISFFMLPPNDWCPNGTTAYVGNMYVVKSHRKQGIARLILSHLLREADERGCERVLLNTTEMGKPLYKAMGFEDSATAMALYPYGIRQY